MNHCPGACATPLLQRVVTSPSRALDVEKPAPVADAVAVKPLVFRTGSEKALNSATDHQLAEVPVWTTRT